MPMWKRWKAGCLNETGEAIGAAIVSLTVIGYVYVRVAQLQWLISKAATHCITGAWLP